MSLRDKWEFQFSAADLRVAADAKRDHHTGRLAWWEGQQTAIIEEVKKNGLSVQESVAGQSYASNSGGYGAQITVDATYQRKLNECHGKVQEHRMKREQYAGWCQVLEGNPNTTLTLHADDYLFFYGR